MSSQFRSKRKRTHRTKALRRPNTARRGRFESLEPRQMLAADLSFAGAFSLINGPVDNVFTSSSPNDGRGGGMVTDAAGNRYVTINGAYRSSSNGTNYSSLNLDLDPGPGVNVTMMTAGLVKLDPNGNVVWTAPLKVTGTGSPVVRVLAAVDANQNVYMVGDFRGTFDVDPGPGVVNVTSTANGTDYGYYMAKLNSAGQLQWVRTLAANELTPVRVDVDGDGNLIVASNFTAVPIDPPMDVDAGPGQFLVQEKGDYDLVILKYSTDGNFVWARQIGNAGASQFGNIPALGVNNQNDVFISGVYTGTLDINPGPGTNNVTNNDTLKDRYVTRLDAAGNFVWGYTSEGPGSVGFRDFAFGDDGSIIIGGSFTGTTDFQPGSGSLSLTSTGNNGNGLVLKLNADASVAWVRQFGGAAERVMEMDLDNAGNIYLGGSFNENNAYLTSGIADFDPGPGVYPLVPPSTSETAFVLSLTNTGDFRWAVPLGGNTGRAQVQGLSVTTNGDVQISGAFRGTGDFDPNPAAETWLTSSGTNQTVFTATLTQSVPNPGAPVVDAGQNQTILVNSSANLDGTVTDDGLPGPLATIWSLQSGPGTVSFGNVSAVDTTATFSTIGTYLLKLQATDGLFTTTDYVTVVVNPITATLTATADTYINGGSTTTNFGSSATLAVSGKPDDAALLKWDLSGIPVGSTLQSAKLSLNVTGTTANTYEIYELKRSWTESQATWKKATSSINWQTAGADGSLDRGTTVLGTVTASATGTLNVVLNAAGLAVVQGWVNSPATNFGFVLQDYDNANKDDLVFSSKETAVAANRPQLQVVYNPPTVVFLSRTSGPGLQVQVGTATASLAAAVKPRTSSAAMSRTVAAPKNLDLLAVALSGKPAKDLAKHSATAGLLDKHDYDVHEHHAVCADAALAALGEPELRRWALN